MDSTLIYKYFPELSDEQRSRFEALGALYADWNQKINVISRKDIDNLYENHVLHSLAIAAFLGDLPAGTGILDVGTGGGFPGIPLAIFYPHCRFHLIDRIGKKLRVAQEVAEAIGLDNVTFQHGDVGECHSRYSYVVSRAVMPLNDLWRLVRRNVDGRSHEHGVYIPGLVCLKGGDIEEESRGIREPVIEYPINEFIDDPRFDTKKIIYIPLK